MRIETCIFKHHSYSDLEPGFAVINDEVVTVIDARGAVVVKPAEVELINDFRLDMRPIMEDIRSGYCKR